VFILLFHTAWTAFVAILTAAFLIHGGPAAQVAIGSVMTCVGLGCIGYVAWFEPRGRARTAYGLTDRRALTVSGGRWATAESVYLSAVGTVLLRRHRDGTGTVEFADFEAPYGEDCTYVPGFRRIADVFVVRDLIEAGMSAWGGPGAADSA